MDDDTEGDVVCAAFWPIPAMITHDELRSLARAAFSTDAPDVLCRLEAPPPPPGDTSPTALRWYADWLVILLGALPPTERLTWQAAAKIIGLPDPSRMGEVLDFVRQLDARRMTDGAELTLLTEADFDRIFKPH